MNLLLLTLLAAGVEIQASEVKPFGWSKDGRYFAWSTEGVMGNPDAPNTVLDVQTGRTDELSDAQLKKFQSAHPLAPLAADRTSPDAKATMDVKPLSGKAGGGWNAKAKEDGSPAGSTWSPAGATGAELRVERDGQSWVSVSWNSGVHVVKGFWSPDGKQVAWLVRPSDMQGMDGTTEWELITGPAGYPRVHVVTEKALIPTAGAKVKALLDGKGFATTYVGKALKPRDASVVYCAAGKEELAKKAAELIPGGATVDKLTWPANAELVVALGKKAVSP
jgi:hypothetical protein